MIEVPIVIGSIASCKGIQDSWILDFMLWISDSRYSIPHSLLVETEFQIPIISGISDSLSCILDSKACSFLDSINKTFPDSGLTYMRQGTGIV